MYDLFPFSVFYRFNLYEQLFACAKPQNERGDLQSTQ